MNLLARCKNVVNMCCVVAVPLLLAGCMTGSGLSQSASGSQELVKQAQQAMSSGAKTRAQSLLEEATRKDPADKLPWLKLAQLHFEQNEYAPAITAGQEALARDNANLDARSIVLVSSLRIAAKSLAELSTANQLAGDTRTEAKKVAQILRETLGEIVLVPPNRSATLGDSKSENSAEPIVRRVPAKAPTKRRVSSSRAQVGVHKPPPSGSAGDSDPFRSLR